MSDLRRLRGYDIDGDLEGPLCWYDEAAQKISDLQEANTRLERERERDEAREQVGQLWEQLEHLKKEVLWRTRTR